MQKVTNEQNFEELKIEVCKSRRSQMQGTKYLQKKKKKERENQYDIFLMEMQKGTHCWQM